MQPPRGGLQESQNLSIDAYTLALGVLGLEAAADTVYTLEGAASEAAYTLEGATSEVAPVASSSRDCEIVVCQTRCDLKD